MSNTTGPLTRAAPLRASSWNADDLTFDLVLSAGAPVERNGFIEILDVAGATWPDSIPLLNSHNRGRLEDQIGTVSNIRNEGREIVATARLSKHSPLAQRIAAELSDGAKYGVSIGYSVSKWAESKPNGKRTLTAKAFEIIEASLVSIAADPAATIRSIPHVTTETNTDLIAIGRRAIISDDLSALSDFSSMIATRAAVDENRLAYAALKANAALSDSVALFHATHKNKATSGTALDGTNVAAAVAALRGQKSLDGLVLNLQPTYLVVGPQQEVAARQLLAAVTATKSSDVNVWSGFAELIVDAEITDKSWYLFAAPGAAPVVVYGYVAGSEGPQVRTERDFDTQAVKVAAGLDFATGVIDFRGAYFNAGA